MLPTSLLPELLVQKNLCNINLFTADGSASLVWTEHGHLYISDVGDGKMGEFIAINCLSIVINMTIFILISF